MAIDNSKGPWIQVQNVVGFHVSGLGLPLPKEAGACTVSCATALQP